RANQHRREWDHLQHAAGVECLGHLLCEVLHAGEVSGDRGHRTLCGLTRSRAPGLEQRHGYGSHNRGDLSSSVWGRGRLGIEGAGRAVPMKDVVPRTYWVALLALSPFQG